jgi:hypothetical protein
LVADPLGGLALVVVAVAGEAVAEGTEWDAVLIVAALQAGEGLVIAVGMADADGAQGMQIGVDVAQDVVEAFASVAEDFANGETGEAAAQVLEAWDGEGVVVVVGWGEGAGDGPEGEEAVVDDVEGLGLVTEVMLAVRSGSLFWILVGIGVVARLVGAGVENIGSLGIAEGGETAVLVTGGGITLAAFLACLASWAGAGCGRE